MIVEEKKAGEVKCPQRMDQPNAWTCYGSRCMAWRWDKVRNPEWQPRRNLSIPNYPDDTPTTIDSTTHGYCGLAGRP